MMPELLPCPLCGKAVSFAYDVDLTPYGVRCMDCGMIVKFFRIKHSDNAAFGETMGKIAEAWNRRYIDGCS